MEIIKEGIIVFFSAIGIASLVWIAADMLFSLGRKKLEKTSAVISAVGEAQALEHTVAMLARTRFSGNRFDKIIIIDCGLTAEAKAEAAMLATQYDEVRLCACPRHAEYIIGRELWDSKSQSTEP